LLSVLFPPESNTVTFTVSLAVAPRLSVTVRRKESTVVALTDGAVKLALALDAPDRVTLVPDVWVQL
jgi:hypothetical protein